jgi:hypothetical protein
MSVKMDPSFATLLVGCLTAFVTIAGWSAIHYFTEKTSEGETARSDRH